MLYKKIANNCFDKDSVNYKFQGGIITLNCWCGFDLFMTYMYMSQRASDVGTTLKCS